jgi:hypothetical protein
VTQPQQTQGIDGLGDIIGAIDGIAFQANMLALNTAAEQVCCSARCKPGLPILTA